MKRLLLSISAVVVVFLALVVVPAVADTQSFYIQGTLENAASFAGDVTIDRSAGSILSADIFLEGTDYNMIQLQGPFQGGTPSGGTPVPPFAYLFEVGSTVASYPAFHLLIDGGSLVGYNGSPLCSAAVNCGPDAFGNVWGGAWYQDSSTLSVVASGSLEPVPEPSSLVLLGSGLMGGISALRRKFIK